MTKSKLLKLFKELNSNEESANEYYRYLLIHQKELDKYHNEMRRVLKMYLNSYIGGGYR